MYVTQNQYVRIIQDQCYAMLYEVILRIFTQASGYLVPNIIRFGLNRVLWGLFGGENVPPIYHH